MIRWEQSDIDRLLGEVKPAAVSEREFQAAVMKVAHQLGWKFYHTHDSIGSQAGFPDLVMVRGERLIFAELKTESGKLSKEQKAWIGSLVRTSAEVYEWRPSMMDEIIGILK
jgi:hypothetical protein